MHADAASLIGARHARRAQPSQDYALAGSVQKTRGASERAVAHWAVVSDGCSTGGHTDLGARAWVLALRTLLREAGEGAVDLLRAPSALQEVLLHQAGPQLDALDFQDGLATLAAVCACPGQAVAAIAGDGLVVAVFADGSIELVEQTFTRNAPLYPAYFLRDDQLEGFHSYCAAEGNAMRVRTMIFDATGEPIGASEPAKTPPGVLLPQVFQVYDYSDRLATLEMLFVATDGLCTRGCTSLGKTVAEVMDFQSLAGSFVHRRLGALGAQWARGGTPPSDDLALGGIYLPDLPAARRTHCRAGAPTVEEADRG